MNIIKHNPYFIIPYLLVLIGGAILLMQFDKGELLLTINQNHNLFLDYLFYYGTPLGNGLFYIFIILILACFKFRFALLGAVSFLITGLLTNFFKRVVFSESLRPKVFFEGIIELQFVEGVKILSYNSFPSGHTAVAFSMFCLLAILVTNKKWGLLFIIAALMGGISRIYLVQHFFVDVYFGSILGVVVTITTYLSLANSHWYQLSSWLDKSLLNFQK